MSAYKYLTFRLFCLVLSSHKWHLFRISFGGANARAGTTFLANSLSFLDSFAFLGIGNTPSLLLDRPYPTRFSSNRLPDCGVTFSISYASGTFCGIILISVYCSCFLAFKLGIICFLFTMRNFLPFSDSLSRDLELLCCCY